MNQEDTRHNIAHYRRYILFSEPLFWGPIVILSLQKLAHMPLPDIYFMESAVVILCVLLDIPAGALADLIGRKRTLLIGQLFLLGSYVGFATMASPLTAWTSNVLWAIGLSFQSGADKALIQNTLNGNGMGAQFRDIEGRALAWRYFLIACCSLVTGLFAEMNLRVPLFMSIPGILISLLASRQFKEPGGTGTYDMRKQIRTIREAFVYSMKKPELRWLIGFSALIMTTGKIWFFTYNPYFELVGMNLKLYGLVFFLLNMIAWGSSYYAERIDRLLGEKASVALILFSTGIPIVLMGLFPIWPLAFLVLLQNIGRGLMNPFIGDFTNRYIDSEHIRTTVLSIRSSSTNAVSIVALAGFGFVTGHFGLLTSLIMLGVTVLTLGKISLGNYKKISA